MRKRRGTRKAPNKEEQRELMRPTFGPDDLGRDVVEHANHILVGQSRRLPQQQQVGYHFWVERLLVERVPDVLAQDLMGRELELQNSKYISSTTLRKAWSQVYIDFFLCKYWMDLCRILCGVFADKDSQASRTRPNGTGLGTGSLFRRSVPAVLPQDLVRRELELRGVTIERADKSRDRVGRKRPEARSGLAFVKRVLNLITQDFERRINLDCKQARNEPAHKCPEIGLSLWLVDSFWTLLTGKVLHASCRLRRISFCHVQSDSMRSLPR